MEYVMGHFMDFNQINPKNSLQGCLRINDLKQGKDKVLVTMVTMVTLVTIGVQW